ncbi:MarR family winged helix-turn-helix transcriptional regulator [Enemella evansiae]|uniref:MarR family winged helix-turn-helix transcriptional regulator n=1 Tax=Enemella evansiae TaxID=2016499 RepID=UPI000B968526|nr:MarR family transcriptional regulator [Enemella evansiae]PFG66531.1 DNA-binding MarR family transcriptional regulator [Propionibacteriaceae bacterium ES.041]OYN93362.1 hypothetical protein CGZ95_18535 [Enemella evansiae]OYN98029.1 hypothetical protein CGZ96_09955 [Enemella evansiae]OYO05956.1 hypothetical protein CGZ97_04595 [Enemella evansiae]OYO11265.1 hypothetical protein BI335_15520 [Enemella evansiae]
MSSNPSSTDGLSPAVISAAAMHSAELLTLIDRLGRLSMANERMRAELAKELKMTLHELNALIYVEYERRITPKALAQKLSMSTGSVTALIDRLTESGLVLRSPHPRDRRSVLLSLTPQGDEVMTQIIDRYAATTLGALKDADPQRLLAASAFVDDLTNAMVASQDA